MPTNFAETTGTRLWLPIKIESSLGCSFAKEMIISLHLDLLSFMSFFIHQVFIALTRDCIFLCSSLVMTSETLYHQQISIVDHA